MDPRHHFCWVFLLITKADFMPSKLRDECILFKTKYLYFIVSEISLLKELDSVLNILIFPYLLVLEIHTGIWKEENVQPASCICSISHGKTGDCNRQFSLILKLKL
jgi:hypothetical protein